MTGNKMYLIVSYIKYLCYYYYYYSIMAKSHERGHDLTLSRLTMTLIWPLSKTMMSRKMSRIVVGSRLAPFASRSYESDCMRALDRLAWKFLFAGKS